MSIQSYDPRDVLLSVNGTAITGFASGTFITTKKNENNFNEYIGAQGEVSFAETANDTGEITFTLKNMSASVSFLDKLAMQRETYAANVVDRNTKTTYGGVDCRIRKPADTSISNEITTKEYIIFVANYKIE